MQFSPLTIPTLILVPLRYYFSVYGERNKVVWDEDPKKRSVEIEDINNLHKIPLEERPRILVSRGTYRMDKTGVSDNMAMGKPYSETRGIDNRINMIIYSGTAQILIEARQLGVCELLTDMVSHFIAWTRPMLCDSRGFKEFGLPMQISDCQLLSKAENDEKFQVQIQFPYIKEEQWKVRNDGVLLKAINMSLHDPET